MKDTRFAKVLIFINSLIPLILLLWDTYRKQVGANPLEFVTRTTGMLTMIFLFLTLAVSPLRRVTGLNWLVRFRRMLGLYAFVYAFLHLMTYVAFDRFFKLTTIPGDVVQRPFIAVGTAAFFLLVPLAITSTTSMVRRLGGKNWKRLHRLTYLAGLGGVLHYWMLVKSDTRIPLTFGFLLVVLLGYRLIAKYASPNGSSPSLFPHASNRS